ncbi:putative quinol monooxygenase [Kitasatospora sp. NPDC057015]|uniref:putative quinol monooxygenase n=1 Tax=Kitasatospora sp. NPDC057015 TaxID=3346001 RepID=UPI00363B1B65
MSIVAIADWLAVRGQEQRVAGLLAALTESALAEPGVIAFRALRSLRDPAAFVLLAEYADEDAARAHRDSDRYRELVQGTIAPLLIDRQVELHAPVLTAAGNGTAASGATGTGSARTEQGTAEQGTADRTDTPRSTAP